MLIKHNGKTHKVDSHSPNGYWYWIGREPFFVTNHEVSMGLATIIEETPNRQFLADFLKLNSIKKTLVSQYLGYSRNWLTQMANDKRRDMADATLKEILKKLHIDWTQDTFINVKATKEHTAYRTRPSGYKHDKHKEMLQRAMWDGGFVK